MAAEVVGVDAFAVTFRVPSEGVFGGRLRPNHPEIEAMDDQDRSTHRSVWSSIADQLIILWHQPESTAAGLLYCLCGLAMIVFLFAVATLPANDIFRVISLFIVVEGYTIVATLMLTMGLRKLLGPQNRFDQFLDRSWWRLLAWIVGSSLIVAVCWLIAVW